MSDSVLNKALIELAEQVEQAHARGETDPNAASLATVDAASGRPSIRTIFVHLGPDWLAFFVNARSGKGRQLAWNPHVALCFFWRQLQKQVTVEGRAEQLEVDEANALWATRPRESTLAAHASRQQARQGDKNRLQARVHEERQRFSFAPVERPEHWLGYRLVPERLEFWDTGWHRMRVRHLIERTVDGTWTTAVQEP